MAMVVYISQASETTTLLPKFLTERFRETVALVTSFYKKLDWIQRTDITFLSPPKDIISCDLRQLEHCIDLFSKSILFFDLFFIYFINYILNKKT